MPADLVHQAAVTELSGYHRAVCGEGAVSASGGVAAGACSDFSGSRGT